VTEEDLALRFGRCRIEGQIASTFKSIVSKTASTRLCEGIVLDSGAGPTITRALASGQNAYFAMVVQLSLLTAVLGRNSLATAIMQIFEKESESAPETYVPRAIPSEEGVRGVLQACEEQTASFDWRLTLLAVALSLGLPDSALSKPLPAVILRGLVYMLPLTQHLPEDRIIQIELGKDDGICTIIVWAHHICGLNVSVVHDPALKGDPTVFGSQPTQVVITVSSRAYQEPSITFLASSPKGEVDDMLKFVSDPDESKIEAVYRIPARGYGKAILKNIALDIPSAQEAVVEETMFIACSFAISISLHLLPSPEITIPDAAHEMARQHKFYYSDTGYEPISEQDGNSDWIDSSDGESEEEINEPPNYIIGQQRIIKACEFLFAKKPSKDIIIDYVKLHENKPINPSLDAPRRIEINLKEAFGGNFVQVREMWSQLLEAAKYLSILILAFVHMENMPSSGELLLSGHYRALYDHPLSQYLLGWDGKSNIPIGEMAWFQAVALLIMGSGFKLDRHTSIPSLLSDHGWSIYLSSFDQPSSIGTSQMKDPVTVTSGTFFVRRGVPCRNSVRKHAIFDGPSGINPSDMSFRVVERPGEKAILRCTNHISYGRPFYGERQDSFIVTMRLNNVMEDRNITRRTGYSELFSALWTVQTTKSCQHPPPRRDQLQLAPGYVTVSGTGEDIEDHFDLGGRVLIALTADNPAARWRTLIAIAKLRVSSENRRNHNKILLRGNDCCFQCTIDQTAADAGRWWVVL